MRVRNTDADKGGLFAIWAHGEEKSTGCRKIVKNTKNRKKMPKYLRMSKKSRKFAADFGIDRSDQSARRPLNKQITIITIHNGRKQRIYGCNVG